MTRPEPGVVHAAVEYQVGELLWTQTLTIWRLDDFTLRELLGGLGWRSTATFRRRSGLNPRRRPVLEPLRQMA